MEDFNSKYSGEQVEALLDQVASGNAGGGGGGGITVETDPVFSASPASTITEEKIAVWDGAADLVAGHDTDISQLFNDIGGKQDAISDLATIREGAANGATAVQPASLANYVSKDDVDAELSVTSTNPVQNNVVFNAFSQIAHEFELGLELKQDVISDLEAIRDGASKGATALQEHQSLKTINGESIVGSGNITISGGGGGNNVWVDAGTATKCTLTPNTTTYLTVGSANSTSIIIYEELPSNGDTATLILYIPDRVPSSISLPNSFWANDNKPVFELGNSYEISFMRTPHRLFSTYTTYFMGIGGTEPL